VSATDERFTGPELLELARQLWGTVTTDPAWHPDSFSRAAITYTKEQRGDLQPWLGRVWLNPPWSNPGPWVELLIEHCALHRCQPANGRASLAADGWGRFVPKPEGMLLVRNDPSTGWFGRAWDTADAFVHLCERTRYWQLVDGILVPCGTPEFSSILFYWGPDAERFLALAEAAGHRGRTLPAHAKRMTTTTTTITDRFQQVAAQEIAKYLVEHPETPLAELAERIADQTTSLGERELVAAALSSMTVGDLLAHASALAPAAAAHAPGPDRRPAPRRTDAIAPRAKAPRAKAKAPKAAKAKAAKAKAPKAKAPRKRKAKAPKSKAQAAPKAAKKTNGHALWPDDPQARKDAIRKWVGDTKAERVTMGQILDHFGINRQMARRAVTEMSDFLKPVGSGRAAHYEVSA